MKKLSSLFALLLFPLASLMGQQTVQMDTIVVYEYPPVNNILKLSPFHFAEGTFMLAYERFLGERSSIQLGAGVHSREQWFSNTPSFGTQGELQFRYYAIPPRNVAEGRRPFFFFKGMFAGPFVSHRWRQQQIQTWDWIAQENVLVDENIHEYGGGVLIGAQISFGNVVFIDGYFGGGLKRAFGRNSSNQFFSGATGVGYSGVFPKAGLNIGIGF